MVEVWRSGEDIIKEAGVLDIETAKADLLQRTAEFPDAIHNVLCALPPKLIIALSKYREMYEAFVYILYRAKVTLHIDESTKKDRYDAARHTIRHCSNGIGLLKELDLENCPMPELLKSLFATDEGTLYPAAMPVIGDIVANTLRIDESQNDLSMLNRIALALLNSPYGINLEDIKRYYEDLSEDARVIFDKKVESLRTQLIVARDRGLEWYANLRYCTDVLPIHREQGMA